MEISTLRPGLLVSLSTRIAGNVNYAKTITEEEHLAADGTKRARWETEKTIADPIEHEEATKLRGKMRTMITAVCSASSFGLLCPESEAEQLGAAIREARRLADDFNARSNVTTLNIYAICGRISPDDVEAVRAIKSEVAGLMAMMQEGLTSLDVSKVREAASRAKSLGQMLEPAAAERVKVAVEVARKAARDIVKAGETGVAALDEATIRKISEQRTAFLDFDDVGEIQQPTQAAPAVDFEAADASDFEAMVTADEPTWAIEVDYKDDDGEQLAAASTSTRQLDLI